MKRNLRLSRLVWLAMPILIAASPAPAQVDSTLYLVVDCMKSTSPDYVNVEQEIWKPIHQELVRQGRKGFWALYGVRFGSRDECDYYTVNTYFGTEALQRGMPDLADIFAEVHPDMDFDEAMQRTWASRKMVRTQLWLGVGGIQAESFRYVYVNLMSAPDANAYVELERTVFMPVHKALVADGLMKGWALYQLASPYGTDIEYSHATVDFMDDIGYLPFGDYLSNVHPDRDVDEIWSATNEARSIVLSELWYVIDRTEW
jgi:hypothetical protein